MLVLRHSIVLWAETLQPGGVVLSDGCWERQDPAGWTRGAPELKPSSASLPALPDGAVAILCESTARAEIPSMCSRIMQWMRQSSYAKISLALSFDLLWYLVAHLSSSTNRIRKKEAN